MKNRYKIIILAAGIFAYLLAPESDGWVSERMNQSGIWPNAVVKYASIFSKGGAAGEWSVSSLQDSKRRLVAGSAQCSENKNDSAAVGPNNKFCFCKMTRPQHGAKWVYLTEYASGASCANYCAHNCAACVHYGGNDDCRRSDLL